jgi:hypothetical protein
MGLELGQTTETVEVKVVATAVNGGSVVEGKRLLDLPLAGPSAFKWGNSIAALNSWPSATYGSESGTTDPKTRDERSGAP